MPVYKRNRVWYYEFKIKGTRYKKAIPSAQYKAEAEQAEAEAKRQVHQGIYGRPTGDQIFIKFAETVWMRWAEENLARPQQARYMLKSFREFFGKRRFNEITSFIVERYKNQLLKTPTNHGTPRNKKSVNRNLAALSRIFRLAIQQKVTTENPVKEVARFPEGQGRIRYLSEDEATRLLTALDNQPDHIHNFVLIALHSGMRFSEIAGLNISHLDWLNQEIILPNPKSKREERVPMNNFVCELLRNLEGQAINGWLLANPRTKQPYTTLKKGLRKLFAEAGIESFTFHCLRHTFATEAIDQGESITTVQSILRHKDLKTTQKYTHAKDQRRHQAVAKMGDFWKKVPKSYPSETVLEFKKVLNR